MSDKNPNDEYILKVNYKKTDCPVCKNKGDYEKLDYELICKKCGCVLYTPYPYVAGKRLNTEKTYAFQKRIKEDKE